MIKMTKLSAAIIVLAMCVLLGTTAWAANSNGITYTAELSKNDFCVSGTETHIDVTFKTSKEVELDSLEAWVELEGGLTVHEIKNTSLGFAEDHINAGGHIVWYFDDYQDGADAPIGKKTDVLAVVTVLIPANTTGEYKLTLKNVKLTNNYGTEFESGVDIITTVTINKHEDGDDNDHDCDNCTVGKNVDEGCHGGTATCSAPAVCTECGQPYGMVNENNHDWNTTPDSYQKTDEKHTPVYTCKNNPEHTKQGSTVDHDYTNGDCPCGAVALTVNYRNVAALKNSFSVEGRVVIVEYTAACKVGYWDETSGKYKAVPATKVADNKYSFEVPAGVTEVLLVIKGDVTGEGTVNSGDTMTITRSLLLESHPAYAAMTDAAILFVADVTGEGTVNSGDTMTITRSLLLESHPAYSMLAW